MFLGAIPNNCSGLSEFLTHRIPVIYQSLIFPGGPPNPELRQNLPYRPQKFSLPRIQQIIRVYDRKPTSRSLRIELLVRGDI